MTLNLSIAQTGADVLTDDEHPGTVVRSEERNGRVSVLVALTIADTVLPIDLTDECRWYDLAQLRPL